MKRTARPGVIVALLLLIASPGLAAGDSAGTHLSGSFVMGPHNTATDFRDEFFSSLGLSLHPGDLLHYNWTANGGSGPALYFEIHTHVPQYTVFRNGSATLQSGFWEIPGTDPYMIFWRNLNNVSENVTYTYDVTPASTNWLVLGFVVLGGGVAVTIVAIVAIRRRRRRPPAPADTRNDD